MSAIEAVVFDLGGVVLGSPLQGIAEYEQQFNIPHNFVNVNVATRGRMGAFARLERGELDLETFYVDFQNELESPQQLVTYAEFTKQDLNALSKNKLKFNTRLLFDMMMEKSFRIDAEFLHAIYILRGSGIKVGALTNNFAPMDSAQPGSINMASIQNLFDTMVESVIEGVRKPEPAAFNLVCERLGVKNKANVVFLDDIGTNAKGAAQVGLQTILVKLKDKRAALQRLQDILLERSALLRERMFTLFPQEENAVILRWNVGKGEVCASAFGHGSHPPVFLLHGGGQTRHAWEKSARMLAKAGFFAIAMDLKGHGDSYWDDNKEDYNSFAVGRDLDQVLIKSGLQNRLPIVIGASLGGLSALTASLSGKFGGLVLVDITPKMKIAGVTRVLQFMQNGMEKGYASLEEAALAVQKYTERPTSSSNSLEGLKKNLRFDPVRQRYFHHWDPKAFTLSTDSVEKQEADNVEYEKRVLEHAKRLVAKSPPVPVLLVCGKRTDIVGEDGIANLRRVLPHAAVVDVAGAGHMVAGDQNDLFGQALLDFAMPLRPELAMTVRLVEPPAVKATGAKL